MPRPTRRLALLLPAAGLIVFIRIVVSSIAFIGPTGPDGSFFRKSNSSLHLGHRQHVADLGQHAANLRRVGDFDRVAAPLEAEARDRRAVIGLLSHQSAHQRYAQSLRRRRNFLVRLHRQASVSCSTVRPRLAAMSAGALQFSSALSVARTMLYGFVEPWHLARMLVTPTTSNTARIGPPAMMPVPSDAGCMNTLVAPCRPCTAWCKDPFFRRTLIIRRRA